MAPDRRGLMGFVSTAAMARPAFLRAQPAAATRIGVDALLVLAIDTSGSLTDERMAFQRLGYANALTSERFLGAVRAGSLARVALAAFEWSSEDRQDVTVPWTLIEGPDSARRFGERLVRAPRPLPGFTSIGAAIRFAVRLLAAAPCTAERTVIDVSGNGRNNDGPSADQARDMAAAAGITVNGLPILDRDASLDAYYAEDVVGGPDAFVVVAHSLDNFAEAVERKLVREIAALPGRGAPAG